MPKWEQDMDKAMDEHPEWFPEEPSEDEPIPLYWIVVAIGAAIITGALIALFFLGYNG